jgi:hypothetical protein
MTFQWSLMFMKAARYPFDCINAVCKDTQTALVEKVSAVSLS